ncbi:MAG: 6,7-dimethyl-8-ribityllumazine synthase [Cellvibrionales bacterium TMED49]|nr:6,7-dimethyl-8-ribityllumazine synthase [Porticoccaceae bacterium]OUU37945.1 MAG: 6,7-dimethyl-8-ribityllumazine synthase [Cellvibrionales bacterium TMED49]|tara:strand:+ start:644 stop:1123 length:480 start_codon:yes stop_codon:yes gene_type:complete
MGSARPEARRLDIKTPRLSVVVARWNTDITEGLLSGVFRACYSQGVDHDRLSIFHVPGAFELALGVQQAARTGQFDGVIALGSVIRGDTPHFDYVCAEATRGIGQVTLEESVPIAFGLLTTDTHEQALLRSSENDSNKGEEATFAVLEMINTLRLIWNR